MRRTGSTTSCACSSRVRLLVIDEIGYLLEGADATFLLEVINKRYQAERSVILTSNKGFGQWGEIFPNSALAIALLNRLLHQATTLKIRRESYGLRHRRNAGLAVPPSERSPS